MGYVTNEAIAYTVNPAPSAIWLPFLPFGVPAYQWLLAGGVIAAGPPAAGQPCPVSDGKMQSIPYGTILPMGYTPKNKTDGLSHSITQETYMYAPNGFGGDIVVGYEYYVAGTSSYFIQETASIPGFWANFIANIPIGSILVGSFTDTVAGAVVQLSAAQQQAMLAQYPASLPGVTPPAGKQGSGNCAAGTK